MANLDEIRLIAYNIWQEEGCQAGRECENWFRAEAIWEEQQKPEPPAKNTITRTKQAARKTSRAPIKKKS